MPAMGQMSERRQRAYAVEQEAMTVAKAAASGPLQSLTEDELRLHEQPVTIYPFMNRKRVRAWVRFGPVAVRVHARIVRSTSLAAGIEFRANGEDYKCWVWGNAVELDED